MLELRALINAAVQKMDSHERNLWRFISIAPEKWSLPPWGNEGGGFWVVGVHGKQCIYYNDIEDGFNTSAFGSWGTISEYWCDQDELQWVLQRLWASLTADEHCTPDEGPAS